jgi:hypothetical protein
MARIRIILEDDNGREMTEVEGRVYELGTDLGSLHDIEGALERFRRQVLPELTAELLAGVQAAQVKDLAGAKSASLARTDQPTLGRVQRLLRQSRELRRGGRAN